jgi:hypothetical protein
MIIKGKLKDVIFLPESDYERKEIVRLTEMVAKDPDAQFNLKGSRDFKGFENAPRYVEYKHDFWITSLTVTGHVPTNTF